MHEIVWEDRTGRFRVVFDEPEGIYSGEMLFLGEWNTLGFSPVFQSVTDEILRVKESIWLANEEGEEY